MAPPNDVRVKICGLSTPETVSAAVDAGADWLGFVLVPSSPRTVSPEQARLLAEPARGRAGIVALTADASPDELAALVERVRPDVLQLHGRESPGTCLFAQGLGVEVWKAVGVASPQDLRRAAAYSAACDAVLLDARPPKGTDRTGGHGQAFDWSLLEDWRAGGPWLLAGGLRPENVAEALRRTRAPAVDVSSGVETSPGVKDPRLISAFMSAVKSA
ncbi:phosphoribosylanthranilate isomerase [Brevundimonas sp. 2R-24]|uniref:N-(5'-phosphoribosyl)anthranilate isomerase n=1 Tax=Peiella sedimenti TaxID=3061083 RepID=A0ABT8SNE2_9CAUL|nr:phosphoribosylanthranilate isomerase [Caulobacteraceae bacterium XZ-24]